MAHAQGEGGEVIACVGARLDAVKAGSVARVVHALAAVDAFWDANCHRDHDKWLERTIADHRAFIFWLAGRHTEALQACERREQLGFERVCDRWSHAYSVALSLGALGRHKEALAVFEEAFSHQDPRYFSALPYHFRSLVKLSRKAGQPVNEKWRSVAMDAAEEFAIKMPARKTLAETLLALTKKTERMPSKRTREWEQEQAKKHEP